MKRLAYHEAGHAVGEWLTGFLPERMELEIGADGDWGHTTAGWPQWLRFPDGDTRWWQSQVFSVLAGPSAEAYFGGLVRPRLSATDKEAVNRAVAHLYATQSGQRAYLRATRVEVDNLWHAGNNWQAVGLLANELYDRLVDSEGEGYARLFTDEIRDILISTLGMNAGLEETMCEERVFLDAIPPRPE